MIIDYQIKTNQQFYKYQSFLATAIDSIQKMSGEEECVPILVDKVREGILQGNLSMFVQELDGEPQAIGVTAISMAGLGFRVGELVYVYCKPKSSTKRILESLIIPWFKQQNVHIVLSYYLGKNKSYPRWIKRYGFDKQFLVFQRRI